MDAIGSILIILLLFFAFKSIGYWKWVWLSIGGVVGIWEAIAYFGTGKTISQQYWYWFEQHTILGWFPVVLVALGGIGLAIHLAYKRIKNIVKKDT